MGPCGGSRSGNRVLGRGRAMCGIAGIVSPAGFAPAALERMSRALEHRGPDASGYLVHRDGAPLVARSMPNFGPEGAGPPIVGFAHRRLSIIDLADRSDQP